jgi:hypothetical protein
LTGANVYESLRVLLKAYRSTIKEKRRRKQKRGMEERKPSQLDNDSWK